MRVALVTIHTPLANVPSALSTDLIVEVGRIVHAALKRDFGIAQPRIGLCGLNPHAGEDGELGREEIEIVNPAAARLRAEGVDVSDARSGDMIFHEALQHCRRIELTEWRRSRTFWQRLKRRWAYFLLARIDPYIARRQWRALPD